MRPYLHGQLSAAISSIINHHQSIELQRNDYGIAMEQEADFHCVIVGQGAMVVIAAGDHGRHGEFIAVAYARNFVLEVAGRFPPWEVALRIPNHPWQAY